MRKKDEKGKKFIVVNLIPTGIKCEIGGFIGDATQITNLLARECDFLITNPNAVNAGAFNFMEKNVLYVEGFAIDRLFFNEIGLTLNENNKIGVIIENINDKVALKVVLKTIEAFSTICGIKVAGIKFIKPLNKKIKLIFNQFLEELSNIEILLRAADDLIKKGAEALAITTYIPCKKKYILAYQKGKMPNPYGQIEAMISHAIIKQFKIPAAHAPILKKSEINYFLFKSFNSDARSSFENISSAYLGSVLQGLRNAPRYEDVKKAEITIKDINLLIVPNNCLGSPAVAGAVYHNIPIMEVKENENIFSSFSSNIKTKIPNLISVDTYQEALEIIKKLRKQAINLLKTSR